MKTAGRRLLAGRHCTKPLTMKKEYWLFFTFLTFSLNLSAKSNEDEKCDSRCPNKKHIICSKGFEHEALRHNKLIHEYDGVSKTQPQPLFTGWNVFTGPGLWNDASKWLYGVPANPGSGNKLLIYGDCLIDFSNLGMSFDSLHIASGAKLSTTAGLYVGMFGHLRVLGTLEAKGPFVLQSGGMNVFGSFINHDTLMLNSYDASIEEDGSYIGKAGSALQGAPLVTKPNSTIINESKLVGNTVMTGTLQNGGILAPGYSPGSVQITGNYLATPAAVHEFEIGGTAAGQYDYLQASGNVQLNGKLVVTFINNFTPAAADNITLFSGNISGSFSETVVPGGYIISYTANTVSLKHGTLLPVYFTKFEAKPDDEKVKLVWEVGQELNVDRYEVERSSNGLHFVPLASVPATGKKRYEFVDEKAMQNGYYRIKSTDKDGRSGWSKTAFAHTNVKSGFALIPNPVHGFVLVSHEANQGAVITIHNTAGNLMHTQPVLNNATQTTIDLRSFPKGSYWLTWYDNKQKRVIKFIRQ